MKRFCVRHRHNELDHTGFLIKYFDYPQVLTFTQRPTQVVSRFGSL